MPTSKFNALAPGALSICCLLFTQCLMDDRHAGTSTSAENTISAVALLPDGSPASGAVVHARAGKTVVSQYGVPESKLIGFTVAGKDGRFKITLADTGGFFLEIKGRASDSVSMPDSFPLVFFKEYPGKGGGDSSLGNLGLLKSGTLQGRLQPDSGSFPSVVWIGIRGTDNFVKIEGKSAPKSGITFGLTEVYPGLNPLAILIPAEVSASSVDFHPVEVASVPQGLAHPGAATDLGTISFRKP